MKKINTIKKFTFILSIGTVVSLMGRIPFRLIPLIFLTGNDYSTFSLTIQTFGLTITIAGLTLHSSLTREIRLNGDSTEIQLSYAISYWITSLIGGLFIFILGVLYLGSFSPLQLLLFAVCVIFRSFMEFFIASIRAHRFATKSAIIASIPAIIEGLIIIPFIFNIHIFLNLDFFIYLYCFGFISSFICGLIFSKPSWKILFHSVTKLFNKKFLLQAFRNIKKGLLLSINTLFHSLGNWLVIFFATKIMNTNSFKILDLCLFFISFVAMFSTNLLISTLSVSKIEKNPKKNKKLLFYIFYGTLISILIIFLIEYFPLDIVLFEFFNLYLSIEELNIIRITILLIFSMFIYSLLGGKIQALGMYKKIAFSSFLAFLGLLSLVILGFLMNNAIILISGLLVLNIIEVVLYYYFIYKH